MPSSADFEANLLASFEKDFDSSAILEKSSSSIVISVDGLSRKESLEGGESGSSENEELVFAVACLHRFLRQNFTGPPDTNVLTCFASLRGEEAEGKLREEGLAFGLNRPFVKCREVELLWGAKLVLLEEERGEVVGGVESADWWGVRTALLWQRVLDEPSIALKTSLERRAERFLQSAFFNSLPSDRQAQFLLEYAYGVLFYYEFDKAEEMMQKAIKAAGIEVEFGGALGKRTRFQQRDIAQLVLKVIYFYSFILHP